MKPFNRQTMGWLMDTAQAAPSGGGGVNLQPPATPPATVAKPVTQQDDAAVQRLQSELNRTRGDLERVKSMVFAPQPTQQPTQQPDKRELEKEFIKSPLDMSAAIAQNVTRQYVDRMMAPAYETNVQNAKQLARQGKEELWDKYNLEIEAAMTAVDPVVKQNTTMWSNAANMVIGSHIKELAAQPVGNGNSPAVIIKAGQGPASPSAATPAPANDKKALTDEEKKWARKFRITDAEYQQGKDDNLNQSDEVLSPTGPSSWDKYITFSSREKRKEARRAKQSATK